MKDIKLSEVKLSPRIFPALKNPPDLSKWFALFKVNPEPEPQIQKP